jgi:hypothetical protein
MQVLVADHVLSGWVVRAVGAVEPLRGRRILSTSKVAL